MKVILIEDEGKTVGWKVEAETTEDKLTLGSMRNLQFFGMNENSVEYIGRESEDTPEGEYVTSMSYATKAYDKKLTNAMLEQIKAGL